MQTRSVLIAILAVLGLLLIWQSRSKEVSLPPPRPKVEAPPVAEEPAPAPAAEPEAQTQTAPPQPKPAPAHAPAPVNEELVKRARRELRGSLSGMYASMKAFYFEHGTYSTDLETVGWQPPDGQLNMKMGFLEPGPATRLADEDPRRMDTDQFIEMTDPNGRPRFSYSSFASGFSMQDLRRYCENRCSASGREFEIVAAANLDEDSDLEVWIINEKKELIQVSDDLGEAKP